MLQAERVTDKLNKAVATELNISEDLVASIIRFQYKTAAEAINKGTNNVEVTGLGVFKMTLQRVKKKFKSCDVLMEKYSNFVKNTEGAEKQKYENLYRLQVEYKEELLKILNNEN